MDNACCLQLETHCSLWPKPQAGKVWVFPVHKARSHCFLLAVSAKVCKGWNLKAVGSLFGALFFEGRWRRFVAFLHPRPWVGSSGRVYVDQSLHLFAFAYMIIHVVHVYACVPLKSQPSGAIQHISIIVDTSSQWGGMSKPWFQWAQAPHATFITNLSCDLNTFNRFRMNLKYGITTVNIHMLQLLASTAYHKELPLQRQGPNRPTVLCRSLCLKAPLGGDVGHHCAVCHIFPTNNDNF